MDYDISQHEINEQLVDTDSEKESSESVIQKVNGEVGDKDYKIFFRKITIKVFYRWPKARKNLL